VPRSSVAMAGSLSQVAFHHDEIGASRTMVAVCSVIAVLVLLPAHALQAHDFVLPYVRASKAIGRAPTDVVIIDKSKLLFAEDLVRNDPLLRNRPKVLDLSNLSDANIERLCTHYGIAMFEYGQAIALGIIPNNHATASGDEAARAIACRTVATQLCYATRRWSGTVMSLISRPVLPRRNPLVLITPLQ